MKKTGLVYFFILSLLFIVQNTATALSTGWVKCGSSINCANRVSGINFPLDVKNPKIRAKNNLIEIKYPFDKIRYVYVRKSDVKINNGDISGVLDSFPVIKKIKLKNGAKVYVRGYSREFFVVMFVLSKNYYSIYCKNGLKKKEVNEIYELIKSASMR